MHISYNIYRWTRRKITGGIGWIIESGSIEVLRQPLVSESDFKLLELDGAAYAMDQALLLAIIDCKNNTYVVLSTEHVQGIGSHTLRLPILTPDGLPK